MRTALQAYAATLILSTSLALGGAWLIVNGVGCNSPVVAPSEQLGFCILSVGLSNLTEVISDPQMLIPMVISACGPYGVATAEQIWTVIENYLGINPVLDGGVLTSVQRARLMRLHDAARSYAAAEAGAK